MKPWIGLASVALVGAVILIALTAAVVIRVHRVIADGGLGRASSAAPRASASALPPMSCSSKPSTQRAVLDRAHARGKESEQLRAVIDDELASVTNACEGPQCAELRQKVLSPGPRGHLAVRRRERARLSSLPRAPEIQVENEPRVLRRLEFYTQKSAGRALFAETLQRCSAFKESIESTLTQHRMPTSLLALVFVSSGCAPLVKSERGAEGMWQLTPAVARRYGLNILPGVVDERHSPHKSTEAAAQYLSDLFEKFDDWSLAFLAYDIGPLAVLTRLDDTCGDERPSFWDLADAQMLTDEAIGGVSSIEAIALILANLEHFHFTNSSPPPQSTMIQRVPANTRLSLVARAARTSVNELREMNRDLQQLSTPDLAHFTLRVPKRDTDQPEQTLLDLIAAKDDSDLCVSNDFDWGRERFTSQMARRCASATR